MEAQQLFFVCFFWWFGGDHIVLFCLPLVATAMAVGALVSGQTVALMEAHGYSRLVAFRAVVTAYAAFGLVLASGLPLILLCQCHINTNTPDS